MWKNIFFLKSQLWKVYQDYQMLICLDFQICTPLSFHIKINDPTILMDNSLLDYATLDENYIYIYVARIIVLPQC
jgi:hypothetical protein